jgi:hypothetical protein
MRVIDRWTTQYGSWDVNANNKYGIDQAHRDQYEAGRLIDGSGADHHIFVKAPQGATVKFTTIPELSKWLDGDYKNGWWNIPMFGKSTYYPWKGEQGPWRVAVNGQTVAEGIGLPDGLHVSTFLVVADDSEPPAPIPTTDKLRLTLEGARDYVNLALELLGKEGR